MNMRLQMRLLILSMLIPAAAAAAPPETLEPLTAEDVPALLEPPAHGVRIIELWALYCAYCETNLRAVAELSAADAGVQAVTVNTDRNASAAAVLQRLRSAQATGVPARAYAGASVQRLNYLIDPRWGGEMPHTVVLHADGTRRSASGTLTAERLKALVEGPKEGPKEGPRP